MKYIIRCQGTRFSHKRSNIYSEDSELPVLVEAGAVPGVPDREDAAGSVVVKPPVLGPQEQVTLSAKTSSNLK